MTIKRAISLPDDVDAMLDQLATLDSRNRSNMVAVLVAEEYKRRHGTSTIVLAPSQDDADGDIVDC